MRITIIGLGLIGGSLGLAWKKAGGKDREITAYFRRADAAKEALQRGAVDRAETNLADSVKKAEVVVIATPPLIVEDMLKGIAPFLPPKSVVTDVASTKAEIMKWAEKCLPPNTSFIGGHPMAGKELSGLAAATADLFRGCTYCLTPSPKTTPEAIQTMEGLVEELGARPLFLPAPEHDYLVAGISHLPFLLSSALVAATAKSPSWDRMAELASSGYRVTTRLAAGSPRMYRDICFTNQEAIIDWLDHLMDELKRLRALVANASPELEKNLALAQETRRKWMERGK